MKNIDWNYFTSTEEHEIDGIYAEKQFMTDEIKEHEKEVRYIDKIYSIRFNCCHFTNSDWEKIEALLDKAFDIDVCWNFGDEALVEKYREFHNSEAL